jgi:hypothetical protein
MQRKIVESSIIHSIGYNKERAVLQIQFKRGHVRDYELVPEEVYIRMMEAPSFGKFYLKEIKGKFDFRESD